MTITLRKRPYDVRKVVQSLRSAPSDLFLIAAHRGVRWNGVPENSKQSISRAAALGLAIIEIDVRLTSDGHHVCLHDDGLGRCTNIAETIGEPNSYSPFTGQGYNPNVDAFPWKGCLEELKLKDEHGDLTKERVLDLEGMLRHVKEAQLDIVIMLDIKEHECISKAYDIIKKHHNHRGVSAMEWCVWKYEAKYYPSPQDLEATDWFKDAMRSGLPPLVIPVYELPQLQIMDTLASIKEYSRKSYVISLEIEMRRVGGGFQNLLEYSRSTECPIKGLGFFAPTGDMHPWDDHPISYDQRQFTVPWDEKVRSQRYAFYENHPPTPFRDLPDADEGLDQRDDIELYRSLGFSWVITDEVERLLTELTKKGLRQGEQRLYVD